MEFDAAPFGIVGLETELGLFLDLLVHKHRKIMLPRLIEMYTVEPAKLLKLDAGTLSAGTSADVTLATKNRRRRISSTASGTTGSG